MSGVAAGVGIAAAVGTVGGAAITAHATDKASERQSALSKEALEYEKQRDIYNQTTEGNRYAAMMSGEQPFLDTGYQANVAAAKAMGLPPPPPPRHVEPPPQYPVTGTPGMPSPLPTSPNDPRNKIPGYDPNTGIATPTNQTPGTTGSPQAAEQMVTMQSPDGKETQQVPKSQVPHYESMGGKVVG